MEFWIGLAVVAGITLYIIGEYLADASAVQFTRNPQGIAIALNRIRWGSGSYVQHPNRASHRHLFFAEAD